MPPDNEYADEAAHFLRNVDLVTRELLRDPHTLHAQKAFATEQGAGALAASIALMGLLARLRQRGLNLVLETPDGVNVRLEGLPEEPEKRIVIGAEVPKFGG